MHAHGGQRVHGRSQHERPWSASVRPGEIGADVCHLNLHKTFCIPHGGGGPGMGPICVNEALSAWSSTCRAHPFADARTDGGVRSGGGHARTAARVDPRRSRTMFIALMGTERTGARRRRVAILNANYIAHRLDPHFPVLYRGKNGRVAHECIVDLRDISKRSGVNIDDVAKRLIDYGFHAPTMAWPVEGTLMIEPTESESLEELDRFCDALIAIRQEIRDVEEGKVDKEGNALKGRLTPPSAWSPTPGTALLPRARRLPHGLDAGAQVLALRRPDRQRLRRPQPLLHLDARRGRVAARFSLERRAADGRSG